MTTRPSPREPNLALRRARQSMRLSQAQFAAAIRAAGNAIGAPNHCTKRLVQKWETGEHAACRPDYLRVLQAVTGLSVRELGFQPHSEAYGSHTSVLEDTADGVIAEYTSDGMIAGSMDRLRRALNHPSTVDTRTAALVETATARLFDLEHHSPARLLAPTVERHLATVTALLTAARHDKVRRDLMISAGRSTLLAGWLSFDRGDMRSANEFWDAAISAAEGSGDESLLAGSLVWQSYASLRGGDPGSAWQLAYTASEHTPDDPRATAWATARVALYAAQLGDHDAAREAMSRSLKVGGELSSPKPGDACTPWTRSFDRARLMASTGHTAALLDDPYAADYAAQAVDSLGTAKVKTRAIVLAEAALTAAIVGELQLCLDYGSMAATLTREMDVSTAADLLHEVIPVVLPYSDTRPVRQLLPQLTQLTRTTDLQTEAEARAGAKREATDGAHDLVFSQLEF